MDRFIVAVIVALCLTFAAIGMILMSFVKQNVEIVAQLTQSKPKCSSSAVLRKRMSEEPFNQTPLLNEIKQLQNSIEELQINLVQNKLAKEINPTRICTENPYTPSLNTSLEKIAEKVDDWISKKEEHELMLVAKSQNRVNHVRFEAFQEMGKCSYTCVGGACREDTSKIVCGYQVLTSKQDCVVYSIGSNNMWEFESDILNSTSCHVYTFDCTGEYSRYSPPLHDRMHFFHYCLGANYVPRPNGPFGKGATVQNETMTLHQIQHMLHHDRIDLLKMDIEGHEWPIIMNSWPKLTSTEHSRGFILPFQLLVEIHYTRLFNGQLIVGYYETDLIRLAQHFYDIGYATIVRDDNIYCNFCSELTLVRFRCPES